jgi:hypothetical protein
MIENEKQLLVTIEKIKMLEDSLKNVSIDYVFAQTQIIQTEVLIKELKTEVSEYMDRIK